MAVLTPGQRLGSYSIERLLGRGGMAEVYCAVHVTLEREVAIKVLAPTLNADPTFPLRFQREARAVARLNHPHIITVYDFGEQGDLAYLVMELASRGTLRERARSFRTLAEAVEALAPVADALDYAHGRGIIHRDVKPINVLITDQERPLLADFGLARIALESLDLTSTGISFGSPHYMAPEQALASTVDHRADIYALGIVAFELIGGRLPYVGTTPYAVIQQHLAAPPPSIATVLEGAPARLDAALRRALAKKPEDRYASAAAFLSDLRAAVADAPDLPLGRNRLPRADSGGSPSASPAASTVDLEGATAAYQNTDLDGATAPFAGAAASLTNPDAPAPAAAAPRPPQPPLVPTGAGEGKASALLSPSHEAVSKRQRPTSFSQAQWLTLGTVALVVIFINAVGLWLAQAGRSAGSDNLAAGITTYIYDHLGAFKSALMALALLLAVLAVVSMRLVAVNDTHFSLDATRRLRQYHRFVGYAAILISFAVGLLTCFGIFGFGTATPRSTLHSILGAALLVVIIVKIAVVRYFPAQRRHLKLLGESLLALFFLVFLTSTVPFLWSHLTGVSKSNPYNRYVGRVERGLHRSPEAADLQPQWTP